MVKCPSDALGFTYWNGMATAIRFDGKQLRLSRRFTDGAWQDYPTSLDRGQGSDELFGVPSTLYEANTGGRFLAFDQMVGFTKGEEASPCSWWRQGPNGVLEPEGLIPLELDGPLFMAQQVRPGLALLQLRQRFGGLRPFLDYPLRVQGGFVVISWNAGVLWGIRDGAIMPQKAIRLIRLDDDLLSGKTPHLPVLLGAQPMRNGHVLVAMRAEDEIFSKADGPPADGKPEAPKILWKEIDPLEGTVEEAEPSLVGDAPRHLVSGQALSFRFDPDGRLRCP